MQKIQLHQRNTFQFNQGWDSEDEWQHVGDAKVLPPRNTNWDGEYGGYTVRVIADYSIGDKDVSDAIAATLSHSCRCEHDCCGHVSESASVQRVSRREYLARIFQSRNI
jgi:hypothetical protein